LRLALLCCRRIGSRWRKDVGKKLAGSLSDGVIAIIITIMLLELKAPHSASFNDLLPLLPVLGSYVLSFIYVGINNHQYGNNPPRHTTRRFRLDEA
jgi:uncharacterized membrane protein